jgi:signal transduction histidine kinase
VVLNARRLIGRGVDDLILVTIEDITERKTEEQQRRSFILLLAHELRNSLTAIMGNTQRMQRGQGNVETGLGIIMEQARIVNRLVGDLLDDSTPGAEQLRLERHPLDLVIQVRAWAQQAQLLDPLRTIRLELPAEPIEGHWDGGRLMQVFANLLGNAIKYSPSGSDIVVRVKDLGTMAQVSIQDQGVGIAPHEIPNLFDQRYRVAHAAHDAPGLGLGLHVAKRLVEAHGGSIAVESVLDQGSTFHVTLPLVPVGTLAQPRLAV